MRFSFDPLDPFPLLPDPEGTYEAAKVHSAEVDAWLGLDILRVERSLGRSEPWAGLDAAVLLTPYTELRFMVHRLGPRFGGLVVELGSGYSRLAHVIARHAPGVRYLGLERVAARAEEAMRVLGVHGATEARVVVCDVVGESSLPVADTYFLYDLSPGLEDTRNILGRIAGIARERAVTVVGRGRATRTCIERQAPWLSGVQEPEHHGNFSIYRS